MSTCSAPGCGRPAQDVLCDGCTTDLVERLEQIDSDGYDHNHQPRPGLYQHLQITYARQDAISAGVRTRKTKGSSQPLPFKEKAAEVLDDLENTVSYWFARFLAVNDHLSADEVRSVPEAAEWLSRFPGLLAMHPDAAEMVTDIKRVTDVAWRTVDRPAEKRYLGRCEHETEHGPCGEQLFGHLNKSVVRCQECGTEYDSADLWEAFQRKVRGYSATPAEISGYIAQVFGKHVKPSTIHTWASRGHVQPVGRNPANEKLYRIGDVLDEAERRGVVKRNAA